MKYPFLYLVCLFILGIACQSEPLDKVLDQGRSFSTCIQGGMVIDGTGSPAYEADVWLRADTIAFIGKIEGEDIEVADTIDARGMIVSPGFIDPHAHGDPVKTPTFQNFLAMGVTTITLGQDGSSQARIDIGKWMDSLQTNGTGPNLAFFAGHGTLRKLSKTGYSPTPTNQQISEMQGLLSDQLEAGCFGLSTGLEYTPGLYSTAEELAALAQTCGQYGAVIMSHMRNEDDEALQASVQELLGQGAYCRVHISHLKSVYGKGVDRAEEILGWLDSARTAGIQVTTDMYPYLASYTGIGIVFPTWAKAPNNYLEVRATRRAELAEYLRNRVNQRNGPEATLLGTGAFRGKTLAEAADMLEKPFEEVLMDDIGPTGASGAYFVMNEALQERLAQDSMVMFCSDGSPTGFHPRGHGTFAKIIQTYVVEKELIPLEEAIRKMTSFPADIIGLSKRGKVQPGYYADLLVFDPKAVTAAATYPEPHQLALGFSYTWVNGQLVKQQENFSPIQSGRILRSQLRKNP